MKVTYSPRAVADLVEIAAYLTARSPSGARAVEQRIHKSVALLAEFPGAGRPLEQRPSVRVLPLGRFPYLIFYVATADELVILHVRHGARKPVEPESL